ncbi:hypothetical protein P3342_006220 [Pyrenophora teres f. teres]|nr:hypothetical protein P3342_006220 [Pyrenophora teres f. teres]
MRLSREHRHIGPFWPSPFSNPHAELLNAFVEIIAIHTAHVDMYSPSKHFSQVEFAVPIAEYIMREIHRFPELHYIRIYLSCNLVPGGERIPVEPLHAAYGKPDVSLQGTTPRRPECELPMILCFHGDLDALYAVIVNFPV